MRKWSGRGADQRGCTKRPSTGGRATKGAKIIRPAGGNRAGAGTHRHRESRNRPLGVCASSPERCSWNRCRKVAGERNRPQAGFLHEPPFGFVRPRRDSISTAERQIVWRTVCGALDPKFRSSIRPRITRMARIQAMAGKYDLFLSVSVSLALFTGGRAAPGRASGRTQGTGGTLGPKMPQWKVWSRASRHRAPT